MFERHAVLGSTATIKLDASATEGRLAVVEHDSPRGAGPPPHLHRREDELLYVLEGMFEVSVGDDTRPAGAGAVVHVPAGTVHATRCTSETGRLLSVYSPAGGEAFFREIGGVDQSDPVAIRTLAERHGITVAG